MGCFSFLCLECGEGVNSEPENDKGESVHLFLLKEGKVIQQMTGEYDNYGQVYKDKLPMFSKRKDSQEWKIGWEKVCELISEGEGRHNPWYDPEEKLSKMVERLRSIGSPVDADLLKMLDKSEKKWMEEPKPGNGIAAIHVYCYKGTPPSVSSRHDIDQGSNDIKAIHAAVS